MSKSRTFLIELGTIVLGVGLALAAQQAAEWWNWRVQVTEARGILASEMAGNLRGAAYRLGMQGCVESRLDELGRILDQSARTGSLPPVGGIGTAPRQNLSTGAWESLVASQTASHFPRAELADLAVNYYWLQRLYDYAPLEQQAWYALGAMVGPGRRLDPASEAELRKTVSLARGYSHSMVTLSSNLINSATLRNLPFSRADLELIDLARRDMAANKPGNPASASSACRPIGAVPTQYGQAGGEIPPETLRRTLSLLPDAPAP